jgi:hypothetical protein
MNNLSQALKGDFLMKKKSNLSDTIEAIGDLDRELRLMRMDKISKIINLNKH